MQPENRIENRIILNGKLTHEEIDNIINNICSEENFLPLLEIFPINLIKSEKIRKRYVLSYIKNLNMDEADFFKRAKIFIGIKKIQKTDKNFINCHYNIKMPIFFDFIHPYFHYSTKIIKKKLAEKLKIPVKLVRFTNYFMYNGIAYGEWDITLEYDNYKNYIKRIKLDTNEIYNMIIKANKIYSKKVFFEYLENKRFKYNGFIQVLNNFLKSSARKMTRKYVLSVNNVKVPLLFELNFKEYEYFDGINAVKRGITFNLIYNLKVTPLANDKSSKVIANIIQDIIEKAKDNIDIFTRDGSNWYYKFPSGTVGPELDATTFSISWEVAVFAQEHKGFYLEKEAISDIFASLDVYMNRVTSLYLKEIVLRLHKKGFSVGFAKQGMYPGM